MAYENNENLGISLPAAKTIGEFEERLELLQKLYVIETRRFQRQLELSQTREEVLSSTQSASTPMKSQGKCCPRILFEQDNHPQILGKIQVGFFQKIDEINHGKASNILFPDKNVQVKNQTK